MCSAFCYLSHLFSFIFLKVCAESNELLMMEGGSEYIIPKMSSK